MSLKSLLLIILAGLLVLCGTAQVFAAKQIYVVNNADNSVTVLDSSNYEVIARIDVGASPTGISYNPANKKAYVVNRGDNTVSVIDTVARTVSGTVGVDAYPWYVAADPTTHKIDLNQWVKGLPVNFVYVTSPITNSLNILITTFDGLLSLPGGAIKTDLPPGIGAFNVALDIDNQMAYVVNCHNAILAILDLKQKKMVAKVENLENTDSFVGVAVDTDLNKIYAVSDKVNIMPVVDGKLRKIVSKVRVGETPYNVVVDSSAHKAYVANRGSNTISVVDTVSDTVEATVNVGTEPVAIALSDDKAYVTNCGSNNLSVIDTSTLKVTDTVALPGAKPYRGVCPWGIAIF
jgi:YVTN family beta-propeller protein